MSCLKQCSRAGCDAKDIYGITIEGGNLCRWCYKEFIKAMEDADRLLDLVSFYKTQVNNFMCCSKGATFFVPRRHEDEKIECLYDYLRGAVAPEDDVVLN